jgi:proton glutamate symport protein
MLAIVLGVVLGGFFPAKAHPHLSELFHFCSRAFLALIKGLVVPLLLSTIVVGVAQTGDLKAVGRLGGKALLYFEVVTTIALFLGLAIANIVQPGAGLPLPAHAENVVAKPPNPWDMLLHLFPSNVAKHAVEADILPIVIFAVLLGAGVTQIGDRGKPVLRFFESLSQAMFAYTGFVMKLTPIGVFGAMAYNMSHMASGQKVGDTFVEGWPAVVYLLTRYARLVGSLYGALFLLIALVFIPIMLCLRIPVLRFFRTMRAPLLTAYTTASSEAALPKLLESLRSFGVPDRIASFVVPTGYSFNLDGSTLYLVLASLSIAQAAGIHMPLGRQLVMVFTFMLTSKGVAAIPRATLVIIAATSSGFGLPGEAGVAMILAVDEIMDMARSLTNVCGNALASVVVAKWENAWPPEPEAKEDAAPYRRAEAPDPVAGPDE